MMIDQYDVGAGSLIRGIQSGLRRRFPLLLGLMIGAVGIYSLSRTAAVLAQEDGDPTAAKQTDNDVEIVTRYVEETRMQDVRDPATGVVTQKPITIRRPVTETIKRGAGGGVPYTVPAISPRGSNYREEVYHVFDPVTGEMSDHRRRVPYNPPATSPLAPPVTNVSEAERRAMRLASQLHQSKDEPARGKLQHQLTEALGEAFDERREQQLQAIDRLERQLQSLRELDTQREKRKAEIVQRRLEELLGQSDVLAWEFGPHPESVFPAVQDQQFIPARPFQLNDRQVPRSPTTHLGRSADTSAPSAVSRSIQGALPSDVSPQPLLGPGLESHTSPTTSSGRLPAENAASFDAAARTIDLFAEIRQIKAEIESLRSQRPPGFTERIRMLESKEQITGAKLQVAQVRWRTLREQLSNQVQLAERQAEAAKQQLEATQSLHASGVTPLSEVRVQSDAALKADLDLQTAQLQLNELDETGAIVQRHLEALGKPNPAAKPPGKKEETPPPLLPN